MNIQRKDAPARHRWDLTAIYPSEEAFLADCRRAEDETAAIGAMKDTLTKDANTLYRGLSAATNAERTLERLYEYAMLSSDLDKGDNTSEARLSKVTDLLDAHRAATYFVSPAIQAIEDGTLEGYFADCPALSEYRRTIATIRREIPHMLEGEGERLLAELSPVFGSQKRIHSVFANADLSFGTVKGEGGETVPLTSATYVPLLMSADRRVRRSAFRTLYKTYRQFGNTFASLLSSRIKEKVTLAKLRRFPDSLTASVFADEVTPDVYLTLIKTVRDHLAPLFGTI